MQRGGWGSHSRHGRPGIYIGDYTMIGPNVTIATAGTAAPGSIRWSAAGRSGTGAVFLRPKTGSG